MKAIAFRKYGSSDLLTLEEVRIPVPMAGEVMVRVLAASVNSWDWEVMRGTPFVNRLVFGIWRPTNIKTLGADIAGRIEAVGANITQFHLGEEVFGDLSAVGWGGFAQYVCVPETALMRKSNGMSFVQAASIPQAGVMALQGIRDYGQVQKGQKVLINGAGGGVGTFALQIAKFYGAEVTAVDSTEKLEMLRSLGADHVVDYIEEDFTKLGPQYDLILDVVVRRSICDYLPALNPGGRLVIVGGAFSRFFQALVLAPFLRIFTRKKIHLLLHKPNKNLEFLKELFVNGKIKPIVDGPYPLNAVPDAVKRIEDGHALGKIVIDMNSG